MTCIAVDYYDCSTLHNWFRFIQKVISFQGKFEEIHDYYVLMQETEAKKDSKLHLLKQSQMTAGVFAGSRTSVNGPNLFINNGNASATQ